MILQESDYEILREPMRLSELLRGVSEAINNSPIFSGLWVAAETVDVRATGGHCYLELVEKDPDTGNFNARVRATIWASTYNRLAAKFYSCTGTRFATGLKVLVQVNVNFHPVYGFSLNITDIDPQYTLGDIERRRMETIRRLKAEGVIDLNRELPWAVPVQRIAVISAPGAAGLGDFAKHLAHNAARLRFSVRLFPAIMQGERCAASVIEALNAIRDEIEQYDNFDCVVVIRGGGATSDLLAFDDYDLAREVAEFPLPVIAGVGHDRDVTVIDYVAKLHVKTPTAAADVLITLGMEHLDALRELASSILQATTDRISTARRKLAWYEASIPARATAVMQLAHSRIDKSAAMLKSLGDSNIRPMATRLNAYASALRVAVQAALERNRQRVDTLAQLITALSPQATLSRGYTITRTADGHAITSAETLRPGEEITTTFADGSVQSIVNQVTK